MIFANDAEVKARRAEPYYTNSTQLPVHYTDDLLFALKHQERLQTKYTGGTVFHIFLGESANAESIKILVRKVLQKTRLPYITVTPTFSICPQHGYLRGKHEVCPRCHARCEVYSRIVGYIRPIENWNAGKQEEFKQRKTFDASIEAIASWK